MSETSSPFPTIAGIGDEKVARLLDGRYRLLDQIGAGGMGIVYRAEHVRLRKHVAIKILQPELVSLETALRRFEREAQSMCLLSHRHIVQVLDFGRTESGIFFLAMELVEGCALADILDRDGRVELQRGVRIARQILGALDHAHARGIIHRDLKPENCMIVQAPEGDELVKILDFGVAKWMERIAFDNRLTSVGSVFGTPDYMAPEQALGEEVDGRADLYACGAMLYEMFTGQKPYSGATAAEILQEHVHGVLTPPSRLAPEIPALIERVILRALEKRPENRYASALEFARELDQAMRVRELIARTTQPDTLRELEVPGGPTHRLLLHCAGIWSSAVRTLERVLGRAQQFVRSTPWRERAPTVLALLVIVGGLLVLSVSRARTSSPTPTLARAHPVKTKPEAPVQPRDPTELLRAQLVDELIASPKGAHLYLLIGHLAFSEQRVLDGLRAYREAARRDPLLKSDRTMRQNLRQLVSDPRLTHQAVESIVDAWLETPGARKTLQQAKW